MMAIGIPPSELFESREHLDGLVLYQLPPFAFLRPSGHRRAQHDPGDSRRVLQSCASDTGSASTRGFASYILEGYNAVSCRKKLATIFISVMFIA